MANPIAFQPRPIDPRIELQRRLEAAPLEHAESLLVAFDLLEEVHRHGLLEFLHGAVRSKDAVLGQLAEYAKRPESSAAIRNLFVLGRVLGSIDPEALKASPDKDTPPSLWQIFKTMRSADSRRGLARVTSILAALGRSPN